MPGREGFMCRTVIVDKVTNIEKFVVEIEEHEVDAADFVLT